MNRPVAIAPVAPSRSVVAVGDFDGDGMQDLAVANFLVNVSILINQCGQADGACCLCVEDVWPIPSHFQ